jgi:hypothetical protein
MYLKIKNEIDLRLGIKNNIAIVFCGYKQFIEIIFLCFKN